MAKSKNINLLPQKEFESSILGRILRWATGSFRILVIITEMIVMAAFLSRFWLDAQNSDLNESIKTKSAQITTQKDIENSFRGLQTKLDVFKNISATNRDSEHLEVIASKVPTDIILTSLSVTDDSSQVKGSSQSEFGIAQFISNLKAEKSFKSVELENVGASQNNSALTDFSLKISY